MAVPRCPIDLGAPICPMDPEGVMRGRQSNLVGALGVRFWEGHHRALGPLRLRRADMGPIPLGKAGMGPVPLGKAGMGPAPLARRWCMWGPTPLHKHPLATLVGAGSLGEPLKQVSRKLPSSIQNRRPVRRAPPIPASNQCRDHWPPSALQTSANRERSAAR
jgi:hypothetical protein